MEPHVLLFKARPATEECTLIGGVETCSVGTGLGRAGIALEPTGTSCSGRDDPSMEGWVLCKGGMNPYHDRRGLDSQTDLGQTRALGVRTAEAWGLESER